MHLKTVLTAAALCALYIGAATQPVKNSITLDSRGRFGGGDPDPPAPIRGDPASPAPGAGAGSGAPHLGQDLNFEPPASFTKDTGNGKGSYLTQGQGVESDLKAASGPDSAVAAVADYSTNIKNYLLSDSGAQVINDVKSLEALQTPFTALSIDGSIAFRQVHVYAGEDDPIHEAYYSSSQKTAIMADLDNSRYGTGFTGNKVFQSQILFEEWSKEAAEVTSLKWIVRSDIANEDTQDIIDDAIIATKGSVLQNTKVTFSADAATGSAEKASFDSLAGTDNGRMVFRMLTDNHEAMNGKTVLAAHTWVVNVNGIPFYEMVWELGFKS